jgi:hypothetical protein
MSDISTVPMLALSWGSGKWVSKSCFYGVFGVKIEKGLFGA